MSELQNSVHRRCGRRVVLVAMYPQRDPAMPEVISNHGMRMVEAMLRTSDLPGLDLTVFDLHDAHADDLTEAVADCRPDIVMFSCYLWSFPLFADVAVRLRSRDPECLLVFGGPSARPAMLDLLPFHAARTAVDVLVVSEGEYPARDLVHAADRTPGGLTEIRGIAWYDGTSWQETAARSPGDLNELPSPYVEGLVPGGGLAVLQTYRGCPYTCSFCEWGVLESPRRVRSAEHIAEEFRAMERIDVTGALLVDAGLNLNSRAFTELSRAVQETGFLRDRKFICELYPAALNKEHLSFLAGIGDPHVGIGLQSFDSNVLAEVERSFDEQKFDENVAQLVSVSRVAIEMIMGLPGDSPEKFRAGFERARSFPCALRVYHCCVLPSALMVRSPPEHRLSFDPVSLRMQSCLGWSREDIERECEFLNQQAGRLGGAVGEYFWVFNRP